MRKRKLLSLSGLMALSRRQTARLSLADIRQYGKYFSELRLRDKIREVARLAGDQLLLPVLRLWFVLRDPGTPHLRKACIVGALGYFILPIDLIPDALGLLGLTDDLAVIMMVSKQVDDLLTPAIEQQALAACRRLTPCLRRPRKS